MRRVARRVKAKRAARARRPWLHAIGPTPNHAPDPHMPPILILGLLFFWFFMAYRALQRGDVVYAVVLVAIGLALTAWRFSKARR
jgi:hypothetical protein